MKAFKTVLIGSALVLCLGLSACGSGEPAVVKEPEAEKYEISFWSGDRQLSSDSLELGTMPKAPEVKISNGMRFVSWDEEISEVTGDAEYHAVLAPALTRHVPYLYTDREGKLNPSSELTCADFRDALNLLAEPAAKKYIPEIKDSDKPVSAKDFISCLVELFPDAAEDAFTSVEDCDTVTRRQAAVVMNALMGRVDETLTVDKLAKGIVDVSPDDPDYADLMEASFTHSFGRKTMWNKVKLKTTWEPGWYLQEDGRNYLIDDNGYLVIDRENDFGMLFDEYGYYTSGNEELDELVRGLIVQYSNYYRGYDRYRLLHVMYYYSRDFFNYLRRDYHACGETGWDVDAALTMLNTKRGNCYNYAAVFCHLARGLGYNAVTVAGTVSFDPVPHGWVEVEKDGKMFICDPEIEMLRNREGDFEQSYFMMDRDRAMKQFKYDPEGKSKKLDDILAGKDAGNDVNASAENPAATVAPQATETPAATAAPQATEAPAATAAPKN